MTRAGPESHISLLSGPLTLTTQSQSLPVTCAAATCCVKLGVSELRCQMYWPEGKAPFNSSEEPSLL